MRMPSMVCPRRVARALRADDAHRRPGSGQSLALEPHPSIERNRQILNDDENPSPRQKHLSIVADTGPHTSTVVVRTGLGRHIRRARSRVYCVAFACRNHYGPMANGPGIHFAGAKGHAMHHFTPLDRLGASPAIGRVGHSRSIARLHLEHSLTQPVQDLAR